MATTSLVENLNQLHLFRTQHIPTTSTSLPPTTRTYNNLHLATPPQQPPPRYPPEDFWLKFTPLDKQQNAIISITRIASDGHPPQWISTYEIHPPSQRSDSIQPNTKQGTGQQWISVDARTSGKCIYSMPGSPDDGGREQIAVELTSQVTQWTGMEVAAGYDVVAKKQTEPLRGLGWKLNWNKT